MATSHRAARQRSTGLRQLALWAGLVVPAGIWALQFAANYALVPWLCRAERGTWGLTVLSLVALVFAAGGLGAAWSTWRRGRARPGDDDLLSACCRFLGLLGVWLGALVVVAIVAQALPAFMVDPCA
jgi:hypothetical protein